MKLIKVRILALLFTLIILESMQGFCNGVNDSIFQSKTNTSEIRKLFIATEFSTLYSTHHDYFTGGQLIVGYQYTPGFSFGLGTKFVYSKYHFDNTWQLHRLRFLPVFIDCRISKSRQTLFTPFLHFSQGVSFNSYLKEDNTMGTPYKVSEQGLYVYGGFGAIFRISNHFAPIVEIGFQGFNMSFNQLAVNPHGATIQIGFQW